jgi:hypothetical protein
VYLLFWPRASLVQLGYGIHQKRIQAAEMSLKSSIAVDMCQERPLTNRMLRVVGVPSSEGRVVESADGAYEVEDPLLGYLHRCFTITRHPHHHLPTCDILDRLPMGGRRPRSCALLLLSPWSLSSQEGQGQT